MPVKDYEGGSEDLMIYICNELTQGSREGAEKYRKELNILVDDPRFMKVTKMSSQLKSTQYHQTKMLGEKK